MQSHQHGLFDHTDLEKPAANGGIEEAMIWTEGEYEAYVSTCEARIQTWLVIVDKLAESGSILENTLPHEELQVLSEVSVDDSISCIALGAPHTRREQFKRELRREAWTVQLKHERSETAARVREESPWILLPPEIGVDRLNSA